MSSRRGARFELVLLLLAGGLFALAAWLGRPVHSGYSPGERQPASLRVLTWNVGGAASGVAHSARSEDVEWIAETLRAARADLVVLQEIASEAQVAELESALGPKWTSLFTRTRGGRVVLLAREAQLTRRESGRLRGQWEIVEWRRGEKRLIAAGLHADAYSSAHRNQVIGSVIDTLRRHRGAPRLLAGDLNLDLDLGKRRDLFSDDQYLDVETYNYVAGLLEDAARGRGSTAEPDRRLDYIFFEESAFELIGAGPWKGRRAGAMDHDPVVADLRWR